MGSMFCSNVQRQVSGRRKVRVPVRWSTGAKGPLNVEHRPSRVKPAAAVLVLLSFLAGCHGSSAPPSGIHPREPSRIISLAPSITEILYELGLERRVVGVTRYCDYPPGAVKKSRVGGYFDINYEAVLTLEPDLVIRLTEHEDAQRRLEDLGIDTLAVDHGRVEGILRSVTAIADRCGVKERGENLRKSLENRILEIQKRTFGSSPPRPVAPSRPRILVAVGRRLQTGKTGEIYVSGRDGYYDDLITLAGGENAYREQTLKFPALSAEGLALLDPDVIIEMVPDLSSGDDLERFMSCWYDLPGLRAVREGRVHILGGDHVVVPGPRFVQLLEQMAEIISAEIGE